jgi:hypothetical protein
VDDLVIGHSSYGLVVDWLRQHPEVAAKMREQNARFVVVEPAYGPLFENTQAAIDAASVPPGVRPLFVAMTEVSTVAETGAFRVANRGQPLIRMRGTFLGYIAIGEGGVAFFDESGNWQVPDAETVLALL